MATALERAVDRMTREALAIVPPAAVLRDAERIRDLMRRTIPRRAEDQADAIEAAGQLPEAWQAWNYHPAQAAFFHGSARWTAEECGRGTGKTEGNLRQIAIEALDTNWPLPRKFLVVGARTQGQTDRLFWEPILEHIPREFIAGVSKSDRYIDTVTGARIYVLGMDEPDRARGLAIDRLWLDEYATMKPNVFTLALRGAMSRPGRPPSRAWLFGTPDLVGGLHFVDLCDEWKAESDRGDSAYAYHWWSGEGIVDPEEWEAAKKLLPPNAFAVEMEARRVSTGDMAYEEWRDDVHQVRGLRWIPTRPVALCLDFNRDPGIAAFCQEQSREDYPDGFEFPESLNPDGFTAVLDEVFIRNTNTPQVMRAVLAKLEHAKHTSEVHIYADASGGNGGSDAVEGSNLELVHKVLDPVLGERVYDFTPRSNPKVLHRLISMNLRLRSTDGVVSMLADPEFCPETIRDFRSVKRKEGAPGELEKPTDGPGKLRSHLTDAIGYGVTAMHPARAVINFEADIR